MFKQITEIFSSGDTSFVDRLFSSEYIDHQKPDWMTEDGPAEFKAIVKLARDSMPNLRVSIVGPIISDNDIVVGRLLWSSNTVSRETIEILKVKDNKFTEHWGAESWSKDLT